MIALAERCEWLKDSTNKTLTEDKKEDVIKGVDLDLEKVSQP